MRFPWLTMLVYLGLYVGLGVLVVQRLLPATEVSLLVRALVFLLLFSVLTGGLVSTLRQWARSR